MLQDDALVSSKAGGLRREEIAPSAHYRVSTSFHAFPALNPEIVPHRCVFKCGNLNSYVVMHYEKPKVVYIAFHMMIKEALGEKPYLI